MTDSRIKRKFSAGEAIQRYEAWCAEIGGHIHPKLSLWWYWQETESNKGSIHSDPELSFEEWQKIRRIPDDIDSKYAERKHRSKRSEELNDNLSGSISAINFGNCRVEYVNPDYSFAYATLIPDVSAAAAYLDCHEVEKAKKALEKAMININLFQQQNGFLAIHAERNNT